jgi:hypothetical protein
VNGTSLGVEQLAERERLVVPTESRRATPVGVQYGFESGEAPPLVTFLSDEEVFRKEAPSILVVPALGLAPGPPSGIFGQGYVGKTIIAMSLGLAVALGRPLWGLYSVRQGSYVHFDYEQGRRLTKIRIQRLAAGLGASKEDLAGRLKVAIYPRLNLTTPAAEDHYSRVLEGHTIAVIDALKGITPGIDENSSHIRDYLAALSRASERTGCALVLLHHAGKTPVAGERPRKESGRGSSAIFDECQSVFVITAKKGEPALVSHEKDRELGMTVADFGLSIEDVPTDDGNPKGGLRVAHLDREQLRPASDPAAKFARAVVTVRECVQKHPGIAGADAVRERVGMKAQVVRAAVRQLIADGEVVARAAPRCGVRLFLAYAAPPEPDR